MDSVRKYRDLLGKLDPIVSSNADPTLHLVTSGEAGTAAAISVRPLLSSGWLVTHLPSVRAVRVVQAQAINEQGLPCRRLEIEVVQSSAVVDVISVLVRHDVERDQESPSSRRSRQRANWDAEERAVRAADTQAAADHRARTQSCEA